MQNGAPLLTRSLTTPTVEALHLHKPRTLMVQQSHYQLLLQNREAIS